MASVFTAVSATQASTKRKQSSYPRTRIFSGEMNRAKRYTFLTVPGTSGNCQSYIQNPPTPTELPSSDVIGLCDTGFVVDEQSTWGKIPVIVNLAISLYKYFSPDKTLCIKILTLFSGKRRSSSDIYHFTGDFPIPCNP